MILFVKRCNVSLGCLSFLFDTLHSRHKRGPGQRAGSRSVVSKRARAGRAFAFLLYLFVHMYFLICQKIILSFEINILLYIIYKFFLFIYIDLMRKRCRLINVDVRCRCSGFRRFFPEALWHARAVGQRRHARAQRPKVARTVGQRLAVRAR